MKKLATLGLLSLALQAPFSGSLKAQEIIELPTEDNPVFVKNEYLLSEARERILFPDLDLDEKQQLIDTVRVIFEDFYVSRESKLSFYPDLVDPVIQLDELEKEMTSLGTEMFEKRVHDIFTSLRDLHTVYQFPSSYGDYDSYLPVSFSRTASHCDNFEVRISAVSKELFDRYAADQALPSIGDEVIEYNGHPIKEVIAEKFSESYGANLHGGFARSMDLLTFRGLTSLLPEEDVVTITLQKAIPSKRGNRTRGGKTYTITLPWITSSFLPFDFDPNDPLASFGLDEEAPPNIDIGNDDEPIVDFEPDSIDIFGSAPTTLAQGVDMYQERFNRAKEAIDLVVPSVFPSNSTIEDILKWGIIENEFGKFGYFKIKSFSTNNFDLFDIIRGYLLDEMADTDGLIFDLRDNPGGILETTEGIVQLFTPNDVKVAGERVRASELGLIYASNNLTLSDNTASIRKALEEGKAITEFNISRTDPSNIGQAYYKPVALFTNARTYSAGDMFTCTMRDNEVGLIYGEDFTTGAGGAQVLGWNLVNSPLGLNIEGVPNLPDKDLLARDINFGYAQFSRFGNSERELIEDFGCEADIYINKTYRDLVTGGADQLRKITRSLAYRSRLPRYWGSITTTQNEITETLNSEAPEFNYTVKCTARVEVFLEGELVENKTTWQSYYHQGLDLSLTIPTPEKLGSVGNMVDLVIIGYDYRGRKSWNLKRVFKFETSDPGSEEDELELETPEIIEF